MKQSDWQKITAARKLLQLEEKETLQQIKKAFRRKCKQHHPDLADQAEDVGPSMQDINEAYDLLMKYCNNFRFPLTLEASGQPLDAEDWWMDRFGEDPLWSSSKKDEA